MPGNCGEIVSQPFLLALMWFPSHLPNMRGSFLEILVFLFSEEIVPFLAIDLRVPGKKRV